MQIIDTDFEYSKENLDKLCVLGLIDEKPNQVVVPIGMLEDGIVYENFTEIPSSLIVGTTGSGKSAFVKTLIVEMMQRYTPNQVCFVICDSRRVDYSFLNSNPFLLVPVLCDTSKVTGMIRWSLVEARKRMNNLDQIEQYPHIFIILDDFGEMSPSSNTFLDLVQLFQIARRTRIHCWIVTSTPSSNVLPTDLKANINHKISFRVSTKSISRIILDGVGAETLDVPGEVIAKLNNSFAKCKSVFLTDSDIADCSKVAIEKYSINCSSASLDSESSVKDNNATAPSVRENITDALYKQAVAIVLEEKHVSISLIQRRVKVGYTQAARFVDQMEKDGLIGPYEGAKPRRVLVTQEQWNYLQNGAQPATDAHADFSNQVNQSSSHPKEPQLTLVEQTILLETGYKIQTMGGNVKIRLNNEELVIDGESISELFFRKPGLLRKGQLSVHVIDHRAIDIPFGSKDRNSLKDFCKQLSMDIKKPLVEL